MNSAIDLIVTRCLTKIYAAGRIRVTALCDVDLTVASGSFLGVSGTSGSGKSTLLNLLGGLDTPTRGEIQVGGKVISELDRDELARYRRHGVGMIFQSFNLVPSLSARENVGLPLIFAGVAKTDRRTRAADLLTRVGLAGRLDHKPAELSGGEQQRVAIARSLINRPQVILADEPTGNLDSRTSRDIVRLLADLNRSQGLAVVMVSHEEGLLKDFADTVIRLADGRVEDREELR